MILKLKHESDIEEVEVQIKYDDMNDWVKRLVNKIKSCDYILLGTYEGKQYKIKIEDVFYIESVDKRTYIYCREKVYSTELKLYQVLDELGKYDFIQISKYCILNLNVLDSIQSLFNSRMEAILTNNEKVTVSRKYIPNIKKALSV